MLKMTIRMTMTAIGGAMLLLTAACGEGEQATDTVDNNAMLEEANDASAMESSINAGEPVPVTNATDATEDAGEGDSTEDEVESNVSGM